MECAEGLHAGAESIDAVAADEGRWALGVHARCRDDVLGGHAGQGLGALRREFERPLAQFVEAVGPALDEFLVVKPFLDHHMDHGEADGGVGAGLRPEP